MPPSNPTPATNGTSTSLSSGNTASTSSSNTSLPTSINNDPITSTIGPTHNEHHQTIDQEVDLFLSDLLLTVADNHFTARDLHIVRRIFGSSGAFMMRYGWRPFDKGDCDEAVAFVKKVLGERLGWEVEQGEGLKEGIEGELEKGIEKGIEKKVELGMEGGLDNAQEMGKEMKNRVEKVEKRVDKGIAREMEKTRNGGIDKAGERGWRRRRERRRASENEKKRRASLEGEKGVLSEEEEKHSILQEDMPEWNCDEETQKPEQGPRRRIMVDIATKEHEVQLLEEHEVQPPKIQQKPEETSEKVDKISYLYRFL